MAGVAKHECRRGSAGTRWATRLVWFVLAVGVGVSCGGHRYPDNWPKMVKMTENGDCTEISGTYVNQAKAAPTNSGTWRSNSALAWFIWNWSAGLAPDVSVEFLPPSKLRISSFADGTKLVDLDKCSCKNGKITIYEEGVSYGGSEIAHHSRTNTYSLYLASDRSLVIEVASSGYSCVVVPWPESDTYYYLVPRAMKTPAKQPVVQ